MHTLFPRHYHIFKKKAKHVLRHKKLWFSRHCEPGSAVINFESDSNKSTAPQEAVEKEGHYGNDSGDYQTGESR